MYKWLFPLIFHLECEQSPRELHMTPLIYARAVYLHKSMANFVFLLSWSASISNILLLDTEWSSKKFFIPSLDQSS